MSRAARSTTWDPAPPSRFADFYARCMANYKPRSPLQRLLDRVPDHVSQMCRDCGTNFVTAFGGPLECYVCGTREVDGLREDLEAATELRIEAERELDAEQERNVVLDRELTAARHDLDDRDQEIERLKERLVKLEGEGYP